MIGYRKFTIATLIALLNLAVPLLFKHFEISDSVIIVALGTVNGLGASYLGANVLDKKLGGEG